jgi:HK97 family phage prohead protease
MNSGKKIYVREEEMMIVRTKGGEFAVREHSVLLDFLRGKMGSGKWEVGSGSVDSDIELIVPVPFCLAGEGEEATNDVRAIPWTFSTFDLDRFDERIDPGGWDFKRFLENPVIEWAHCYDIPAIGKAEGIYADEKGLHGSIIFNDKSYDPFGWAIGERVRAGVIRAGSVGFRVLEIELPDKEAGKDGTALIFRKQELLEFSVCNVPANPFALAQCGVTQEARRSAGALPDFWGGVIENGD